MRIRSLFQIVPQLPPQVSGVGDFAVAIASELRGRYGIETHFVISDPYYKAFEICGFPVSILDRNRPEEVLDIFTSLPGSPVILHYSGYGYQLRGAPHWLVSMIKKLNLSGSSMIVTLFHELYATGKLWQSSFWLSPFQRRIAAQLSALSHSSLASTAMNIQWLKNNVKNNDNRIARFGVFSTIGEPTAIPLLKVRDNRLVLFGRGWFKLSDQENINALRRVCSVLNLNEIVWIGGTPRTLNDIGVKVIYTGVLPSKQISDLLLNSKIGFLTYFPGRLAKSTVFSAFGAHGLVNVSLTEDASKEDGIIQGLHTLSVQELVSDPSTSRLQLCSDAAQEWYRSKSIAETTRGIVDIVESLQL